MISKFLTDTRTAEIPKDEDILNQGLQSGPAKDHEAAEKKFDFYIVLDPSESSKQEATKSEEKS